MCLWIHYIMDVIMVNSQNIWMHFIAPRPVSVVLTTFLSDRFVGNMGASSSLLLSRTLLLAKIV